MENNKLDLIIKEFVKILEDKKEPINFYALFEIACKNLNFDEKDVELMSDTYYKIMLLKDFVLVGKNEWSLRKFYKYQTIKKFNDETMKIEKDSVIDDAETVKLKDEKDEEEVIDEEIVSQLKNNLDEEEEE